MFNNLKSRPPARIGRQWLAATVAAVLLAACGGSSEPPATGARAPSLLAASTAVGAPATAGAAAVATTATTSAASTAQTTTAAPAAATATASATAMQYSVTLLSSYGHVEARGVNARGQITGGKGYPPDNNWHAFLYDAGNARDLGLLPGGDFSAGTAINSAGKIAGNANVVAGGGMHAFYYDGTAMRDLGTLGGPYSYSIAINDSNQIAGYAFLPGDSIYHAFRYDSQGMHDLGTLGGTMSNSFAINNAGLVVGAAYTAGNASSHAFVHDGIAMRDLGTLGGNDSSAADINAAGQIIGSAQVLPDNASHAFLYQRSVMRDLGTFGGSQSFASDINDAGQIAGAAQQADGSWRPFFHDGRTMHNLGSLGGDAYAFTINERGQVIGYSFTANNADLRGFVWSPGDAAIVDLNTRLANAPAGMEIVEPWAISNDGVIIADSNQGLVMLTPLPCKPTGVAALIAALDVDSALVATGTAAAFSARFTDTDRSDSHTATWNWGNGDSSPGRVSEHNGSGSVSGSKTYVAPGLYTVALTLLDSGGNSSVASRTLTVFDAANIGSAGNGWFASPVGALASNAGLAGRVDFAFVSAYAKGATRPAGKLHFAMQSGKFAFDAEGCESLVLSGAQASCKGGGTLNGAGAYRFELVISDGRYRGGDGRDRLHLTIWHSNRHGAAVLDYDSQPRPQAGGAVIGGGQIVVKSR